MLDNVKADLALVQEPYTGNSTSVRGFPNSVSKFYSKTNSYPVSVTVLRNNHLQMNLVEQHSYEYITVTTVHGCRFPIALINVYFPPRVSNFDTHLERLSTLLNKFPDAIIAGDFNCRHPSWGDRISSPNGEMLYGFIENKELTIVNESVTTCRTYNGSSAIDLTLSSGRLASKISNWQCSRDTSSDHSIIWFDIEFSAIKIKGRPSSWKFVENSQTDWGKFQAALDQDICSTILQLANCASTSQSIEYVTNQLQDAICCTARDTLKPKGRTKLIRTMQPIWWDDECITARKNYHTALNSESTELVISDCKRAYQRLIRNKRLNSWKAFIEEANNPSAWGNLYRIIKNKLKRSNEDMLFLDCHSESSKKQRLDCILHHFFPTYNDDSLVHAMSQTTTHTPGSICISARNVSTLIKSYINPKKAPGPDGITNGMIKHLDQQHALIITSLFQRCIDLEYFPTVWKAARVVLVPKPGKDNYTEFSSYRPISLLPCLGKMFEKILAEWLDQHLEDNSLINSNQFGFRKNHSAIDALDLLVGTTREKRKAGYKVSIITFDIKGAFDNVSWSSVLTQLNLLGVPSKLFNIIASFLSDREVQCCYGGITAKKSTSRGTPQGSVLSPLLWNIVMNSFLNLYSNSNSIAIAYADDISIVCWNKNKTALHDGCTKAIAKVNEWCQANSLELSLSKTKFICIGAKLDNVSGIIQSPSITVLGIIIDDRLLFHKHIRNQINKCQKASRCINKYCRLNFGLDSRKRVQLYTAWIRPILTYGSEIWGSSLSKLSYSKLKSCEHQFLKFAIKGYRTISYISAQTLAKVTDIETFVREKRECHLVKTSTPEQLPDRLKTVATHGYTRLKTANMLLRKIKFSRNIPSTDFTIALGVHHTSDKLIAGYIVEYADGSHRKKFAASNTTSVKFAFGRALLYAVQYLSEAENIRNTTIKVLSKSPLLICGDRKLGPNLINILKLMREYNIRIVSIKAEEVQMIDLEQYINSIGKVRITQKEATKQTISRLISANRANTSKNLTLQEFFPGKVPDWFYTDYYTTTFLTGHGPFNEYLKRFNLTESDLCPCNMQASQTVKHILTECATFDELIGQFFYPKPQTLSEFVRDPKSLDKFRSVTKGIYNTLVAHPLTQTQDTNNQD